MIFGYARVSTKTEARDGNSLEAQREGAHYRRRGKIYTDTFTGKTVGPTGMGQAAAQLRRGDVLIVTRLDRLARSGVAGVRHDHRDDRRGHHHQRAQPRHPVQRLGQHAAAQVLLSFAQFERDMIVQRTQEGKAVARATDPDFREGRPPKFDTEQLDHAMELLENHSYTQVVKLTGISKSTLIREKKRRQA